MRKCALHNLGCKVNSYETQVMQQMMEEAGYEIVEFGKEPADVYIINTCSVTNIADRKSRQMIHKAKKLNPDAIVAATGCYVEAAGDNVDEDVDIAIGNNEKSRLVEILDSYFADVCEEKHTHADINKVTAFDDMFMEAPMEHTRAYVKIQDGCNRFCTYCIIPYVRGRIRSRRKDDIFNEVSSLARKGCAEVVLTGIHLSSYGLDMGDDAPGLIDIIEMINAIEGIKRIRLGSLEPRIVTEEFAKRLAACEKICPHFHLSLQSGCDATLVRMNRKYTTEEFAEGVGILRRYFDNPAITTDVIVGFPGETEEEFNVTYEYLKQIKFYELHVFKYSRRKGTMADKMPDQIDEQVKSARSDKLLELDEELSTQYREKYIGQDVCVLTEEVNVIDGTAYMTGFTPTYVKVAIPVDDMPDIKPNTIVTVRAVKLLGKDLVIGVAEN
ncbi:MAG: tRNA (N(6)-L-threonylcarbamoyladenosine(37)-C(2))-methylthiotransferase MtaB [Lachnospiraceae bacterium]|nr:tRNA (N(6)-L-threonylcarbamoyladenosine(37)-C(2))-methylthiotransferase MtaB [Lachnospiraceae bacterium]